MIFLPRQFKFTIYGVDLEQSGLLKFIIDVVHSLPNLLLRFDQTAPELLYGSHIIVSSWSLNNIFNVKGSMVIQPPVLPFGVLNTNILQSASSQLLELFIEIFNNLINSLLEF